MFADAPLPQQSLLWGHCGHEEPLLAIHVNDIHGAKQFEFKVEIGLILMQHLPKLGGLDLSSGTSHSISVHVFLKTQVTNVNLGPSEWYMNLNMPREIIAETLHNLQNSLQFIFVSFPTPYP